ncbi:serine hydrolase domain-containing protein [Bacillus horti]|uniref:CubicO group peptidase (Beta-lactamase class C family) n=1 Tax=Caldalkalibacillus horti TaxID=77523 RepID=A0ABT9VXW4_9BACI|nr:serine hydrolase domain-containing protein [Bacillus horti]MDQ0165836.1 CubicO group peptidase (beta-lactamase class C family) [Bacillus horti]
MKRKTIQLAVICVLLLLVPFPAFTSGAQGAEGRPFTAEHVEEFVDHYIMSSMEEMYIPGTVIIVVKDGEVLFEKGYGYDNVELERAVDPGASLFRIGSVTKLFTATAIMQLVEQGRLDLDQDVNQYLDGFQVDTGGYAPIQLRHLLTHTAGFEEKNFGMAAEHYENRVPLKEYVTNNQPNVIRTPGEYIQYSNYGIGLLGVIIEDVSGLSYEDYIKQYILEPLNMQNTYVMLNEDVEEGLAKEYSYANDQYTELSLYDYNYPPAGSMISTAEDMAKFIQAHLNLGELNGVRIMEASTAELMHDRQFSQHPLVQGFGFGFFENLYNQLRILEHGGNTDGSNSMFMIEKESNWGLFISNNGVNGAYPIHIFGKKFVDEFFPNPQTQAPVNHSGVELEEDLTRYQGIYHLNRYGHDDISKFVLAINPSLHVKVNEEQGLQVTFFGETVNYEQVEPLVFFNPLANQYIAFEEDANGAITHLFDSMVFEKKKWYEDTLLHAILAGALLLFSIAILLTIAIRFFIKRIRKKKHIDIGGHAKSLKWLSLSKNTLVLNSLIFILFIMLIGIGLVNMMSSGGFSFELPIIFIVAFIAPILMVGLTLFLGFALVKLWMTRAGTIMNKMTMTLYFMVSLSFLLVLHYYNWIGFNF